MPNRVLLVEDNPAARYVLAKSLTDAGLRVTAAASAEEALYLWDASAAMLVDVNLPGMSGIEFCRLVKQSEGGVDKHVVLYSSVFGDGTSQQEAGLAAGADLCMARPAESSELARVVKKVLFPNHH